VKKAQKGVENVKKCDSTPPTLAESLNYVAGGGAQGAWAISTNFI